MKSLVKPEVIDKLNDLIKMMFKGNSFLDFVCYDLEYKGYHDASDIIHHKLSHRLPVWADLISDAMYNTGGLVVRKSFEGDFTEFSSIEQMFKDLNGFMMNLADEIAKIIEELEFNYKNRYLVIELENLLEIIQPWVRVTDTWQNKAIEYSSHDNLYKFDKDFHTFITLPEQ